MNTVKASPGVYESIAGGKKGTVGASLGVIENNKSITVGYENSKSIAMGI